MIRTLSVLVVSGSLVLLLSCGGSAPSYDLLIENVTVLSPERPTPLRNAWVAVRDGKIANLLLLDENPLESVQAWDSIHSVVLHGRWIERDSLSAARE
jgi:hypothetical protein